MSVLAHPYRSGPRGRGPEDAASPRGTERVIAWLVVGAALLQLGFCALHGLNLQGLIALVLLARSLT